jgi:hypothetical protein
MMEQFLDSLTEEQAELLGLNEVESGVEGSGTSTIARGWNAFKTGVRNAVVSTPSMQRSIETNVQNASRKAIGDTNEPHKIVSELPTSSMIKRLSSTTPTPTSTPAAPARNSQFDMSNLGQGKVGPSGITGTTQDAKPSTGRESEAATSLSSGGFQFPGRGKNADTAASMATPTAKPTTPAPAPAPSTGGGSGGSSRPSSTSSSSGSSGSSSGYTERSSQGRDWKEKAFSPDTGG